MAPPASSSSAASFRSETRQGPRSRVHSNASSARFTNNRPTSPTFSQATTSASQFPEGGPSTIITRNDLRQSLSTFSELIQAAKAHRQQLLVSAQTTGRLASALEACSRLKGTSDEAASGLQACGGLQHLISNQELVLADGLYKGFEIPLLEVLDTYSLSVTERQAAYESSLHTQSTLLRRTEAANLKIAKKGKRDLSSFRNTLALLQQQVDAIDDMKASYHNEVLEAEEEIWDEVLLKVGGVVKSQIEVFERITGKAGDLGLEPVLNRHPDPFESYGAPLNENGQIFSVLSPIGIPPPPAHQLASASLRKTSSSGQSSKNTSPSTSHPHTPRQIRTSLIGRQSEDEGSEDERGGFLGKRSELVGGKSQTTSVVDVHINDESDQSTPTLKRTLDSSSTSDNGERERRELSVIGDDDDDDATSTQRGGSSDFGGDGDTSTIGGRSKRSFGGIPFPAFLGGSGGSSVGNDAPGEEVIQGNAVRADEAPNLIRTVTPPSVGATGTHLLGVEKDTSVTTSSAAVFPTAPSALVV